MSKIFERPSFVVMSASTPDTLFAPNFFLISETATFTLFCVLAHTKTLAPSPKNSSAQARPMPRVPPVTRMRWKSKRHLDCVAVIVVVLGTIGGRPIPCCGDIFVSVIVSTDFIFFDGRPRPRFDGILTNSSRLGGDGVLRTDLNAPSFGTFFSAYGKPMVNVIALDTFSLIIVEFDFTNGACCTRNDC